LLLFLVVIAAMIHFLVASQAMALVFYFLPTLYSAYYFGRRHATLTACASVCLVVWLAHVNPAIFNRRVESLPLDSRWFDITVWGGVLDGLRHGHALRAEPEKPAGIERRL
jgi:hypothetical protein